MYHLQVQDTHHNFHHRKLPSGLTVSICEIDGWTAAGYDSAYLHTAESVRRNTHRFFRFDRSRTLPEDNPAASIKIPPTSPKD